MRCWNARHFIVGRLGSDGDKSPHTGMTEKPSPANFIALERSFFLAFLG